MSPEENMPQRRWLEMPAETGGAVVRFSDYSGQDRRAENIDSQTPFNGVLLRPHFSTPAESFTIPSPRQPSDPPIGNGNLVSIEGIESDMRPSRERFESYIGMRNGVKLLEKIDGPELDAVQESVRGWLDGHQEFTQGQRYDHYDREHVQNKLLGLNDFLRSKHPDQVHELELATTEAFIDSTFAMYEDRAGNGAVSPDADGSFAFVVPARMSRNDKDYGQEVEPAIPALRYVPNELRAQMLVGVPPFIIDTYRPDSDGKRGYLVFSPIFGDMQEDMVMQGGGRSDIQKTSRYNIDNAVDFAAERLGVSVVGLGATLPTYTNFGRAVKNKDVLITTGHGGTAFLVKETAQKAIREGLVANAEHPRIGVLGLGAIGAPIAKLSVEEFDPPIRIYDKDEDKRVRTERDIVANGYDVLVTDGESMLIKESDVIISAIVGRIPLARLASRPNLKGKVVIDDSQPGSFSPQEVQKHGGRVVWVIGRDTSEIDPIEREGYDYATMADEKRDLFGCEAEAATLYKYSQELKARSMSNKMIKNTLEKVGVREPVSPAKARLIGALFKKYGIEPSEMQAFGQLVERPQA